MVTEKIIEEISEFIRISYRLKRERRKGWITRVDVKRSESVADHIFGTSLLALVIGDLKSVNTCRMLRLALIHDLAEAIVGDKTPEEKGDDTLEDKAIEKMFSHLPHKMRKSYFELWHELKSRKSPESKLFWQIDKLEMGIQSSEYILEGYSEKKLSRFLESAKQYISDTFLIGVLKELSR